MSEIYCPICGESMDIRIGALVCPNVERGLSKKASEWILRSLGKVDEAPLQDLKPRDKEYYFCPNCRGRLIEYTTFDRYFKCECCSLQLKAMAHFEFERLERLHTEEDPETEEDW